jgi:hypothetical protein
MKRRRGAVLVLCAASAALSADGPPPSPDAIERKPEFVQRVGEAIDRGVAWLKKTQAPDGSFADFPTFPGAVTALAYHTMRVCGVPRDDRAASRAWTSLRRAYKPKELQAYTAALDLMAVAEHGDQFGRENGDRVVRLTRADLAWAGELTRALVAGQDARGVWDYHVGCGAQVFDFGPGYYDHSNMQYALLGLKAAARCGVPIDASVWKKALTHFLDAQENAGPDAPRGMGKPADKSRTMSVPVDRARGWGYQSCGSPIDRGGGVAETAMTAAGISSIVICRSELIEAEDLSPTLDADSERAAWDGVAWIGKFGRSRSLGAKASANAGRIDLYEAYGIERAGVLAGVEWMGPVDRYGAGAESILAAQAADGGWSSIRGRAVLPGAEDARTASYKVVDACFALLFLKKGTTPVRRGAVTRTGDDVDINFAEAAKVSGKDLEDVLDLVLARRRRASDERVKARLFDGATSIGPKIVEPLLVRMDSPDVDRRSAAHELLKRATDLDFGWAADAPPDARGDAVVRWQTWWMGAKDKLLYDPATKTLVAR